MDVGLVRRASHGIIVSTPVRAVNLDRSKMLYGIVVWYLWVLEVLESFGDASHHCVHISCHLVNGNLEFLEDRGHVVRLGRLHRINLSLYPEFHIR